MAETATALIGLLNPQAHRELIETVERVRDSIPPGIWRRPHPEAVRQSDPLLDELDALHATGSPPVPTPPPPTISADNPNTLADLREYVAYREAMGRFQARRQTTPIPQFKSHSEAMNYSYSVALSTPIPGRITDAIAPTLKTFRWLLEAALPRFGALNSMAFDCLVVEVLEKNGRSMASSDGVTLDEFDKLRIGPDPARKRRKKSPPQTRREAMYEGIRDLYPRGRKEAAILEFLKTSEGKDLKAEVQWELGQRPAKRGDSSATRSTKDVVQAALRKLYGKKPRS